MLRQPLKRETAKISPTGTLLALPVVPHAGESDTDALAEAPAEAGEEGEEEKVDEFGYTWSEFTFVFFFGIYLTCFFYAVYLYSAATRGHSRHMFLRLKFILRL